MISLTARLNGAFRSRHRDAWVRTPRCRPPPTPASGRTIGYCSRSSDARKELSATARGLAVGNPGVDCEPRDLKFLRNRESLRRSFGGEHRRDRCAAHQQERQPGQLDPAHHQHSLRACWRSASVCRRPHSIRSLANPGSSLPGRASLWSEEGRRPRGPPYALTGA